MYNDSTMMLFAGNSNPTLAQAVARQLQVSLGKATVDPNSGGLTEFLDQPVVKGVNILVYGLDTGSPHVVYGRYCISLIVVNRHHQKHEPGCHVAIWVRKIEILF